MEERRGAVLLGVVERYALHQKPMRRSYCSLMEQRRPQSKMCRQKHRGVLRLLRQRHELLSHGVRRLVRGAHKIITPQATQHWKKPLGILQVATELPGTSIGLFHLRRRSAFGGNQRRAQGDVQRQLLLAALRG
jgi:hypothetical protein